LAVGVYVNGEKIVRIVKNLSKGNIKGALKEIPARAINGFVAAATKKAGLSAKTTA